MIHNKQQAVALRGIYKAKYLQYISIKQCVYECYNKHQVIEDARVINQRGYFCTRCHNTKYDKLMPYDMFLAALKLLTNCVWSDKKINDKIHIMSYKSTDIVVHHPNAFNEYETAKAFAKAAVYTDHLIATNTLQSDIIYQLSMFLKLYKISLQRLNMKFNERYPQDYDIYKITQEYFNKKFPNTEVFYINNNVIFPLHKIGYSYTRGNKSYVSNYKINYAKKLDDGKFNLVCLYIKMLRINTIEKNVTHFLNQEVK